MSVIAALWSRNLKAFLRNRTALVFSFMFPLLFIYIFAGIFKLDYIENPVAFMVAGIIITVVFESSIRISSSTIDDMTGGFMKEVLVSPVSRVNIAIGQFISSATIATIQGLVIYIIGLFLGLSLTPLALLLAIPAMIFVGLVFSGFGLFLATKAKDIQTFQAISMAITMPLMFLSGAYIPLSMLPTEMQWVAYFNPMTYAVVLFRVISLGKLGVSDADLAAEGLAIEIGGLVIGPFIAAVILAVFGILFLILSTVSFLRTDFSKMNRNKNDSLEF
jgi:ABC-2 type transport system permease protein